MKLKFGWRSWLWRALALCMLVTFPIWWIVAWYDELLRGKGFWETGWLLFLSCAKEVLTGEG